MQRSKLLEVSFGPLHEASFSSSERAKILNCASAAAALISAGKRIMAHPYESGQLRRFEGEKPQRALNYATAL